MLSMKIERKDKQKEFVKKIEEYAQVRKEKEKPAVVIEFSWKLILLVLSVLGILLWGQQLFTMVLFLFLSLVVMSSALPIVRWFVEKKIPKGWAVTFTYFVGIVFVLAVVSVVVIPFIGQIDKLIESVPLWINSLLLNLEGFGIGEFVLDSTTINRLVTDWLERLTFVDSFDSIASTVGGLFSWTSIIFAAIVFSIYLVIDHNNILDFGLLRISSDEKRGRVKRLVLELESKLGRWLLGQIIVSSIAGIVLGSVLALFEVPFALPIGVLIALLSTIPTLGATFSAIPPLLIALVVNGPLTAVIILLIFVVYQQIENNFIIPRVMGNAVGVRPILVLFAAITFLILFGVWGAVLAVPTIVIARICYEFYIDLQKIQAKGSI